MFHPFCWWLLIICHGNIFSFFQVQWAVQPRARSFWDWKLSNVNRYEGIIIFFVGIYRGGGGSRINESYIGRIRWSEFILRKVTNIRFLIGSFTWNQLFGYWLMLAIIWESGLISQATKQTNHCVQVVSLGANRVLVSPGNNMGIWWALLRSFIKNISLGESKTVWYI